MIGLLCFVLTVLVSAFKSKSRPEAENAALRYQLIVLRRKEPAPTYEQRSLVLRSALSLVPVDPSGPHNHPARHPCALASGRLSPLLALEVAHSGRATTDRDRAARAVPAHERREPALGCDASSKALGRVASSNGTGEWSEDPQSVEKPSSGACLKSPNATRVLPFFARYHQQCIAGSAVDPVVLEVDVYAHVVGAISSIQS